MFESKYLQISSLAQSLFEQNSLGWFFVLVLRIDLAAIVTGVGRLLDFSVAGVSASSRNGMKVGRMRISSQRLPVYLRKKIFGVF